MRSSYVQVNDIARLLVQTLHLVFVLLPSLLVSFKFFILVLALLGKLGFFSTDYVPLRPQLITFCPEQVLES